MNWMGISGIFLFIAVCVRLSVQWIYREGHKAGYKAGLELGLQQRQWREFAEGTKTP